MRIYLMRILSFTAKLIGAKLIESDFSDAILIDTIIQGIDSID